MFLHTEIEPLKHWNLSRLATMTCSLVQTETLSETVKQCAPVSVSVVRSVFQIEPVSNLLILKNLSGQCFTGSTVSIF